MPNETQSPVSCMIIDDEPMARDVIKRYILMIPTLELKAEFGNAIEATLFLQNDEVDIIFLDINMPQLSGIEFVKSLRQMPIVIFTTAHKNFAFEGFELDVADYLLKPIRFDRFLRAVNKALPQKQHKSISQESSSADQANASNSIYLRADRKMKKVLLEDIIYIESDKDYVKVYTENGVIISRQTIASVETMLCESQFVRIHRSYIISTSKLKSFTSETVGIGDKQLPIGKFYRNNFLKSQSD